MPLFCGSWELGEHESRYYVEREKVSQREMEG